MPFTAGQKLRASQLQNVQPITYNAFQTGNGGGQQAVTTTETDCLAASVTFTSLTAANCVVVASFDLDVAVTGATIAQGRLSVDAATITTPEAHLSGSSVTRTTATQSWTFTLSAAGTHTVKLRILKTAAAATINCVDGHTRFSLILSEVV